jgi:arginine decarboxylase
LANWNHTDSARLYGIDRWGKDYFSIGDQGTVNVDIKATHGTTSVSLMKIIEGLSERDLQMPVMLRIENLIRDRVIELNEAFRTAIADSDYASSYRAVFPIKVNQQKHVIDSIARAGSAFGHGLEAGSKAELIVAMASVPTKESIIVCNGYKDEEFIDLGLQAQRLGYNCFFVVETVDEIELIILRSKKWNIDPLIGARLKLSTKVDGHWAGDSGDRSLFGMTAVDLMTAVDMLRKSNMLNSLQMLHFHLGSQIPNIRNIRDGIKEACRYYIDLLEDGAPLGYFDIGGGLAVDYDGTFSTKSHSRNYDLKEYCVDIVESIMNSLDPHDVPHPTLVSESGRWTVAPTSVLLFNILSVTDFDPAEDKTPQDETQENKTQEDLEYSNPVINLLDTFENLQARRVQENYNDAIFFRDQLRDEFRAGSIRLRERAFGENIALKIFNKIATEILPQLEHVPTELESLNEKLADIYYGNFSVFQSLPDAWAIEQVFPVMPLHRLHEQPTRTAIIADLTCDCDGKLDRFTTGNGDISRTLPLHTFNKNEPYFLGVFLVGAYQETLGDLHNLFGDTHVASVLIGDDGEIEFVEKIQGDTIGDVLGYVEHQPEELFQMFRVKTEAAVGDGVISVSVQQEMIKMFRESLRGYTYFEH